MPSNYEEILHAVAVLEADAEISETHAARLTSDAKGTLDEHQREDLFRRARQETENAVRLRSQARLLRDHLPKR